MKGLIAITEILKDFAKSSVSSLLSVVLVYLFLGGTFIALIWIVVCHKVRKRINSEIASISFTLTCIPFEKNNEEATIYMLKAIKKM